MNAIEWKDATSYSQGQRGKIDPDAWECRIGGIRVWIGSGHRYYPGEWVMHCHELGISEKRIGPTSALSEQDARNEAIKIAGSEASRKATVLVDFAAACQEQSAERISTERQTNAELVEQLRRLVDEQEGGDAVVLVQRQLFNRVVGRLAETLASRQSDAQEGGEDVTDEQVLNVAARIQDILADNLEVEDGEIIMTGPASYKIARLFKPAALNPRKETVGVKGEIPNTMPGHWSTEDGAEMAKTYAAKDRSDLGMSQLTDFELANAIFMANRGDLDLIVFQTAAKERIRWLSAKLAVALRAAPSNPVVSE